MVFTDYEKRRILTLHKEGFAPPTISRMLKEEGIQTSRRGILKFLTRYAATGTITRQPGSGRRSVVTVLIKAIVEQQMRDDDETTAIQLHQLLISLGHNRKGPFYSAGILWAGPSEVAHIANLYGLPTRPKDCSGHSNTFAK